MNREHQKQKALVVFVREPELGAVKTRLVKSGLSKAFVLDLYKAFIEDVLSVARQTSADRVFIYVAFHKEQTGFFDSYRDECSIRYQEGETLGDRMYSAFMDCFLAEYPDVVLIGSDCLTLQPIDIEEAFKNLEHADATLGPSSDGGYYLLGLNKLERSLFSGVEWGSENVLEQTQSRLTRLDLDCLQMQEKDDIDTLEDLEKFEQTSLVDYPALKTRQILKSKAIT